VRSCDDEVVLVAVHYFAGLCKVGDLLCISPYIKQKKRKERKKAYKRQLHKMTFQVEMLVIGSDQKDCAEPSRATICHISFTQSKNKQTSSTPPRDAPKKSNKNASQRTNESTSTKVEHTQSLSETTATNISNLPRRVEHHNTKKQKKND